ncbi:MAG: ABC transporter permease subunit [Burkholderiales bacterium]|nr:ABC transporter permease subunit [Burkholderiales bacterium]
MMKRWLARFVPKGRTTVTAIPYSWLLVFFVLPFFFVLKISFSEPTIAKPPYTPLVQVTEDTKVTVSLNPAPYRTLTREVDEFATKPWTEARQDSQYLVAYWNAIKLALLTTILTLLIGYPIAYNIARSDDSTRNTLLMLVMIPFWTSFLLRVYAWIGILKDNGVINNILMSLGVIHEPISMLYTPFSVLLGMVYNYLPFMILPLYANLVKLDGRLLEAAEDLGSKPWPTFFQITLPLSRAGIIAGSMMVFIPAVGEYVIPSLLGGGEVVFIGNKLWEDYGVNLNWPQASAVAVVMLALLCGPIIWLHRFEQRRKEQEQ